MAETQSASVVELLVGMVEGKCSDLHLVPGYRPTYRRHGDLTPAGEQRLEPDDVRAMLDTVLTEPNRSKAADSQNLDCSICIESGGQSHRYRLNVFRAHGHVCACFRHVPEEVPSFDWMGFPESLADRIVSLRNGLVIITGVTGSGKTTTLASLINLINMRQHSRIITVEQPIEYVYSKSASSMVTQREVGVDVDSFCNGLVHGLRQDPDVVLVGEIRDRPTARMALSAAETGHLILTTLHTQDAKGAITRLVDLFPHDAQDDVRAQLSLSLRYVICQHLLPNAVAGERRALAMEILTATHAVRAAIRFGKIESIESAIQTGRKDGMISLDECLADLASRGRITWDTAKRFAKDPATVTDYADSKFS